MVPNDDVEGGWGRYDETQELLTDSRAQQGRGVTIADPATKPTAQKIEKHGQIDIQYLEK